MPSILDAPDFRVRLSTPFSREVFELHLNSRVRAALHAAGTVEAAYDPQTIEPHMEDPDAPPDPKVASWWIDVDLGVVTALRRTVHGSEETLERTELSLHAEREGDEEFNGIRLRVTDDRERPLFWNDRLTGVFHSLLRGLIDADLPAHFDGLRDELPPFDPGALAQEAIDADTVFDSVIEDWWNAGTDIDLARLLDAIESGAKPSHRSSVPWAITRTDEGTRLTWPLVLEAFRVELAQLRGPLWAATRYWLTVDIGAEGALEKVAVRTDQDQTWTSEADPEPGGPSLAERISETAYTAIDFVNDFARRSEASLGRP